MSYAFDDQELNAAIQQFPVVEWISKYTIVHDSGGENFYADCPVCKGKSKLGIHRRYKIFHCFRCNEGEHGGETWNGRCLLPRMIMILDRVKFSEACAHIRSMAGFPDRVVPRRRAESKGLPKDCVPLSEAPMDHPAMKMMIERHVVHLVPYCHLCLDGKYANRVILPALWFGTDQGWEAKHMVKGKTPKSLFPEWFVRAESLYASLRWVDQPTAVVTESIFDAETIGVNTIGLFGSKLTDGQFEKLLGLQERGIKKLIWMLDWDAFKSAAQNILRKTSAFFQNEVAPVPYKSDPNEMGRLKCLESLHAAEPLTSEFDIITLSARWGYPL